jgi:rhodanese-related sulfurtransferase
VLQRLEMVACGLWVATLAKVGLVVVWSKEGTCRILFHEGFILSDKWMTEGCLFVRFIHQERSGTVDHYTRHSLCRGVLGDYIAYDAFPAMWNQAVTDTHGDGHLMIQPTTPDPYCWLDVRETSTDAIELSRYAVKMPLSTLRAKRGSLSRERPYIVYADDARVETLACFLLAEIGQDALKVEPVVHAARLLVQPALLPDALEMLQLRLS